MCLKLIYVSLCSVFPVAVSYCLADVTTYSTDLSQAPKLWNSETILNEKVSWCSASLNVPYCHAVQSTATDKKENKSLLLLNLCILIKHFLLNIHLLPHTWSLDVLRVLHQEKSSLPCQMSGQGHFCRDCSCISRSPSSAWQMVQSWGWQGWFPSLENFFSFSSVSWGQKAKTMVRS